MRNVMEAQLSWFALFMTAFYSLLASCRADDCGHEALARCARPLERISSNAVDFVTTKEELDKLCPKLEDGMQCIQDYTNRCMDNERRERFAQLYRGTGMAVMELCHDGPNQEEFLAHALCMQEVKPQFDLCSNAYTATMQSIDNGDHPNQMKSICCSFQEYLSCSHHTVLRRCGQQAASFTKKFLDGMSSSLIKMHCESYALNQCPGNTAEGTTSSGFLATGGFFLPALLFLASRYLLI